MGSAMACDQIIQLMLRDQRSSTQAFSQRSIALRANAKEMLGRGKISSAEVRVKPAHLTVDSVGKMLQQLVTLAVKKSPQRIQPGGGVFRGKFAVVGSVIEQQGPRKRRVGRIERTEQTQ